MAVAVAVLHITPLEAMLGLTPVLEAVAVNTTGTVTMVVTVAPVSLWFALLLKCCLFQDEFGS